MSKPNLLSIASLSCFLFFSPFFAHAGFVSNPTEGIPPAIEIPQDSAPPVSQQPQPPPDDGGTVEPPISEEPAPPPDDGGDGAPQPDPDKPAAPGEEWIPAGATRCEFPYQNNIEECKASLSRFVLAPTAGLYFKGYETGELFELFHGLVVPEAVINPEVLRVNHAYLSPDRTYHFRCTMYYFPVLKRSPAFYCNFIIAKNLLPMDWKSMTLKITEPQRVALLRSKLAQLGRPQNGYYYARSNYFVVKVPKTGSSAGRKLQFPAWTLSCTANSNQLCQLVINGSTEKIQRY